MQLIGLLGQAGSGKDTASKYLVTRGFYVMAFADHLKVFCQMMFGWSADKLWGPSGSRNKPDPDRVICVCPDCGFHNPVLTRMVRFSPVSNITCPICRKEAHSSEYIVKLTPRYALQNLGSDWVRDLDTNAHVKYMAERILMVHKYGVWADPLWSLLPEIVKSSRIQRRHNGSAKSICVSDCRFLNEVKGLEIISSGIDSKIIRIVRSKNDQSDQNNTKEYLQKHDSETQQQEIKDHMLYDVIHNDGTIKDLHKKLKNVIDG